MIRTSRRAHGAQAQQAARTFADGIAAGEFEVGFASGFVDDNHRWLRLEHGRAGRYEQC